MTDADKAKAKRLICESAVEKMRTAQKERLSISASPEIIEQFFFDAMTPEERLAVSRLLVSLGKAEWLHADCWVR